MDVDLEVALPLEQRFIGERREAQLVDGVGSVGDQLPEENLMAVS